MKWIAFAVAAIILAPVILTAGIAGIGLAALTLFVFAPLR